MGQYIQGFRDIVQRDEKKKKHFLIIKIKVIFYRSSRDLTVLPLMESNLL